MKENQESTPEISPVGVDERIARFMAGTASRLKALEDVVL